MKRILFVLLCLFLFVVPVSADAFSAWSAYGDAWKATDGIMRDDVYGRPVPAYNVSITNTTFGESYSSSGNSVGFFMVDETDGVYLTANRCYLVEVNKTGYASNSTLKCVRAS